MSEFNASNFKKEEGGQGPDLCGVTELTSPYFMVPPSGTTAQRPSGCAPGTLRFNTDIGSLEYYKGDTIGWESIVKTTPNLGGGLTSGSIDGTGARAIFAGGYTNAGKSTIFELLTINLSIVMFDFSPTETPLSWQFSTPSTACGLSLCALNLAIASADPARTDRPVAKGTPMEQTLSN